MERLHCLNVGLYLSERNLAQPEGGWYSFKQSCGHTVRWNRATLEWEFPGNDKAAKVFSAMRNETGCVCRLLRAEIERHRLDPVFNYTYGQEGASENLFLKLIY